MPLDPMIANPAPVKINDPLDQYNNFLLASTRMSGLRKEKRDQEIRNALVEGYRQHTDAQGKTDFNALRSYVAQNGLGDVIPGMLDEEGKRSKTAAEIDETKAKTGLEQAKTATEGFTQQEKQANVAETKAKTFDQKYKTSLQFLNGVSPDPKVGGPQVAQWIAGNFNDPDIGPILLQRGLTSEAMIADLKATKGEPAAFRQFVLNTVAGLAAASKQNITTEDLGGHKRVLSTPDLSFGTPQAPTVISDQKVTVDPNSALKATRVNVNVPVGVQVATGAAKKFGEVVEEARGEEFASLDQLNSKAPRELAEIDRTLGILNSGKVITGWGAEARTNLLAMAKTLNIKVDNPTLINTQMLRQQIANSLFNRMGAFKAQGLNLTPMSNLDLDKLEKTGPQIADDPEALKRMFLNYRESITTNIERYNELKTKFGNSPYTGETMNKVYQPGAPTQAPKAPIAPPPKAIAKLIANPGTAAAFEKTFNLPPGTAKHYIDQAKGKR